MDFQPHWPVVLVTLVDADDDDDADDYDDDDADDDHDDHDDAGDDDDDLSFEPGGPIAFVALVDSMGAVEEEAGS